MSCEWPEVRIGDVLSFSKGVGYKGSDLVADEAARERLLSITAIRPGGGFKLQGLRPFAGRHREHHVCRPGDIVIAMTDLTQDGSMLGSPAVVPQTPFELVASHHVGRVHSWDELQLDGLWLFYRLRSVDWQRHAATYSTGTTVRQFKLAALSDWVVALPSLREQQGIRELLRRLDQKIESNRRLAAAADAAWLTQGAYHLRDATPVEVQRLLGDGVLVINDGYRAKNSELADDGIAFVRAGNLTDSGLDLSGADRVPPELAARVGIKQSVSWDTAFTSKGTVGRITLVDPDADTFVYSPQVCFWRSLDTEQLSPFVLHAWMRSARFIAQVDAVKGQTDMADYVSLRDQRAMHFDLPEPAVQREVARLAEPLARAASGARKEARTLTAIRDTLLPKLVTGQIRVPLSNDVDELIGAATEALA